ncbi:MAG: Protein archease [Promethearchaeota archaeon]|nr:MAG: Protein archease [Candidatus Lokiarchaeota archaeon]
MKEPGFEFLEHTADIKIRCWGTRLEQAFTQAAYALMTVITPQLDKVSQNTTKHITLEAEDKEALLFDFLSEFLFIFDVEKLVFSFIEVESIKKTRESFIIDAQLRGEEFNKEVHEVGTEVKAITYSYMKIEEKDDEVIIELVLDI